MENYTPDSLTPTGNSLEPKICKHFLSNKGRPCRFEAYKESEFCHHHLESNEFVPCTIDPNHTVLKHKLKKHLKVCPKFKYERDMKKNEWFIENLNKKAAGEEVNSKTNTEHEEEEKFEKPV